MFTLCWLSKGGMELLGVILAKANPCSISLPGVKTRGNCWSFENGMFPGYIKGCVTMCLGPPKPSAAVERG